MAIKRAKIIPQDILKKLLKIVANSEHALRDEVAMRLSHRMGLRAGEIAGLRWQNNILTSDGKIGKVLHITGDVGKRAVERELPMPDDVIDALKRLRRAYPDKEYVFYALHNNIHPMVKMYDRKGHPVMDPVTGEQRKKPDPKWEPGRVTANAAAQWFLRFYKDNGLLGCSSHSGRRTAITRWVRDCNKTGNSVRDAQIMAGHKRLDTTAGYIEPSDRHADLLAG